MVCVRLQEFFPALALPFMPCPCLGPVKLDLPTFLFISIYRDRFESAAHPKFPEISPLSASRADGCSCVCGRVIAAETYEAIISNVYKEEGAVPKGDVVREVAWILYWKSVPDDSRKSF